MDVLAAREQIADAQTATLPWLDDEDREEAVARLNERAGYTEVQQVEQDGWGRNVERITLDDFRAEIGAPPRREGF